MAESNTNRVLDINSAAACYDQIIKRCQIKMILGAPATLVLPFVAWTYLSNHGILALTSSKIVAAIILGLAMVVMAWLTLQQLSRHIDLTARRRRLMSKRR